MKEEKTLEAIVKRCQGECYIEMVGYTFNLVKFISQKTA